MKLGFVTAAILVAGAVPALADDCTQPIAALMDAAKNPYAETIVTQGADGKPVTSHMVQTATTKYVELNGSWTSLPISSNDLVATLNEQLKTAKTACTRTGTDQVNGQPATVYAFHMEIPGGVTTDGTMWISAQNRELKADTTTNGKHVTTTMDFANVQAPAGAKPLGQR